MKGQLSEQPLAELIREISSKSLSGRLRLEHERIKIVAYFENGSFRYAASNLRTLRLREYLRKSEVVSDTDLAQFNEQVSDPDLLKVLCAQKLLSPAVAEQLQTRQVVDIVRLALSWTEGTWDFESRSRLDEQLNFIIDLDSLILEATRRMPVGFATTRLKNPEETISPIQDAPVDANLVPAEGYLLSRLDRPMTLRDISAICGLGEDETVRLVYSLALAGFLKREHWEPVFRDQQPISAPVLEEVKTAAPPVRKVEPTKETDPQELENFLTRIKNSQTHYDVLDVGREVSASELKTVYYQLARRYHPDRFRKLDAALVSQVESAFARITQAYDTLRDDRLRSGYNAKIDARRKAEQIADAVTKPTAPVIESESVAESVAEPVLPAAERAEIQFKEGLAALELGQRKVALGHFASAASTAPKEPRYRAFYGQMLAGHEQTRRAAETELLAAIKLEPGNAEYRVILAELYRDLGLKLRAKGEAERAVAADPNNRKARELLRSLTS
jgi:DnaJ-class molecular chaperone with C-terminal Zn finger domain